MPQQSVAKKCYMQAGKQRDEEENQKKMATRGEKGSKIEVSAIMKEVFQRTR